MPVTTKVPLGADTLNRKWYLDVNTGTSETPIWTGVFGISEFKLTQAATTQDSSDFDGEGWKSSTNTALEWGAEFKCQRKTTRAAADEYDPGQEVLRLASIEMGLGNEVEVRIYEVNGDGGPEVEAYQGFVGVAWEPDGGGMDALDTVSTTLTGHGKRTPIAHPGTP